MNKELIKSLAILGGGVVLGFGAGFVITRATLKAKYAALADEEIQSVKDSYKMLYKEGEFSSPEQVVLKKYQGAEEKSAGIPSVIDSTVGQRLVQDILQRESMKTAEELGTDDEDGDDEVINDTPEVTTQNVFTDVALEAMDRNSEKPYLISVEEFEEGTEYEKTSLPYFEYDNTLADEREMIIRDIENTVGSANLALFGVRSGDENIVYVRNEKLQRDFEITRDLRGFKEVVLGIVPEQPVSREGRDDE